MTNDYFPPSRKQQLEGEDNCDTENLLADLFEFFNKPMHWESNRKMYGRLRYKLLNLKPDVGLLKQTFVWIEDTQLKFPPYPIIINKYRELEYQKMLANNEFIPKSCDCAFCKDTESLNIEDTLSKETSTTVCPCDTSMPSRGYFKSIPEGIAYFKRQGFRWTDYDREDIESSPAKIKELEETKKKRLAKGKEILDFIKNELIEKWRIKLKTKTS